MKFTNSHNHPFHIVTLSPWPLLRSLNLIIILTGLVKWFHLNSINLFILRLLSLIINSFSWWRDIIRERTYQGCHTLNVEILLRLGIILFITSEVFFFLRFFWAFFHISLSPNIEIGGIYPPINIKLFPPIDTPLLNTIILLTSGISITWRHWRILNKSLKERKLSLILTSTLGIYFSYLQFSEYSEASFCINDSSFGGIFFIITGFHGIHVIIGTLFITISIYRLNSLQFSNKHHFGFEASSWYWHFVDVIWLFVYIFLYWWPFYLYSINKFTINFQLINLIF